jgi:hypothetical protein
MVALAGPGDWLIASPGPASRGTWDCVAQGRARGLRVVVIRGG